MIKISKVAAIMIAASYFPNYPNVSEFHITEDEQAFEDLNNATNHARSFNADEVVFTVTREEAESVEILPISKGEKQESKMHVVTTEDLELSPALAESGVKENDEIMIPAEIVEIKQDEDVIAPVATNATTFGKSEGEIKKSQTAAEKRAATNAAKKAAETKA